MHHLQLGPRSHPRCGPAGNQFGINDSNSRQGGPQSLGALGMPDPSVVLQAALIGHNQHVRQRNPGP